MGEISFLPTSSHFWKMVASVWASSQWRTCFCPGQSGPVSTSWRLCSRHLSQTPKKRKPCAEKPHRWKSCSPTKWRNIYFHSWGVPVSCALRCSWLVYLYCMVYGVNVPHIVICFGWGILWVGGVCIRLSWTVLLPWVVCKTTRTVCPQGKMRVLRNFSISHIYAKRKKIQERTYFI